MVGTIYAFTKEDTGAAFSSAIFWYIVGGCFAFGATLVLLGSLLGTKVEKKHIGNIMMGVLGLLICGDFFAVTQIFAP